MIRASISFLLNNYSLTFFAIGIICALIAIARVPRPVSAPLVLEKLLAWYVFFAIDIHFFYNFVMHVFFGRMSAAFIGWADSSFQFEVGTASLGFAAVAFIAAFRSFDLRLAAILGPAMFELGAAAGHVHQMTVMRNFSPRNAGIVFYMDIILPPFGFALLWLQSRFVWSGSANRLDEGETTTYPACSH